MREDPPICCQKGKFLLQNTILVECQSRFMSQTPGFCTQTSQRACYIRFEKNKFMKPSLFTQVLLIAFFSSFACHCSLLNAQALRIPDGVNLTKKAGQRLGVTDVEVTWNAPAVRGRQGKIWGTEVAHYGFKILGFGSNVFSPWRAGANECTTISFSTDVTINDKKLPAGKYAFFIALGADSSTLIFNKNVNAWGSYFYDPAMDVLRVNTRQVKDHTFNERLNYVFEANAPDQMELSLQWENWKIPMLIGVDLQKTTLASIQSQMSGAIGFDPASLEAAAKWCLTHETNYEQALNWIETAVSPALGGIERFEAIAIKAGLLEKLGRVREADILIEDGLSMAKTVEVHNYGRQLLAQKKTDKALEIFEYNFKKNQGAWPTHVGMMRALSAKGRFPEALEHAKEALKQAQNDNGVSMLKEAIMKLEKGQSI